MPSKSSTNLLSEHGSWLLKLGAIAVVLFLHVPIWLIFLYSFTTDTAAYTFPPPGLTLKWIPQALTASSLAGHCDRHCHALCHQFDEPPVLVLDHCDWTRDILRGRRL